MKGLLMKEFLLLKGYKGSLLYFLVISIAFSSLYKSISFIGIMSSIFCMVVIIGSFSFDLTNGWDKFAACLPIKRNTVIKCKYIMAISLQIIMVVVFAIVFLPLLFFGNAQMYIEMISALAGSTVSVFILLSILIPLVIKFGAEKGRLLFSGATVAVTFGGVSFFNTEIGTKTARIAVNSMINNTVLTVIFLVIFLAAIACISYLVSVKLYSNKEY